MNEYELAVKRCAFAIRNRTTNMDAFELSTALAIAFAKEKETVINDIMFCDIKFCE